MSVFDRGDDPSTGAVTETKFALTLSQTTPAVVVSAGSNGFGGRDLDGNTLVAPAANTDEINNSLTYDNAPPTLPANGNTWGQFVARGHSPASAACNEALEAQNFCEYDDLVVWLSAQQLFNQLVNASLLP